jgi:hypothetical protein
MTYNPFDKLLNDLVAKDLDMLIQKEVAEGYWVEYKSIIQPSKKIAKSIASFANTYGGWYFIGVDADKIRNVATKINGFSLVDFPDPIATLRESIKANIDPTPVFHHRLIELESGNVVLVVEIPENQETPFITSDGRIYRRVSDSSDPVLESNRYAVDRLVDNGREFEKRFDDFCQDTRTFSQSEEKQGWLNIYLYPYPLGLIDRLDMLSPESIEKLMNLSQTPLKYYIYSNEIGSGNIPFNSGQLGFGSVILKQMQPGMFAFNGLSIELFVDGRTKFYIPLSYVTIDGIEFKSAETRKILNSLLQSDKQDSISVLRFFDVHQLWSMVILLLNFYKTWFGEEIKDSTFRVAMSLENIWRSVPFQDSDEWGLHVQKFGLPIQSSDFVRIPNRSGKSINTTSIEWHTLCSFIGMAFGLSPEIFTDLFFRSLDE